MKLVVIHAKIVIKFITYSGNEDTRLKKIMAVSTFGTIGEFDPLIDDWNSYTDRLEQYLITNDAVSTEKKCAILLIC